MHDATRHTTAETDPGRRRLLVTAAWTVPALAVATAVPMASASTIIASASLPLQPSAFTFTDPRFALAGPLSFEITGSMAAHTLIHVVLDSRFTPAGGGPARGMPFTLTAVNGPDFVLVGTVVGGDGTQTMTFRVTRDLSTGMYRKTIGWASRSGTTADLETTLSTWSWGDYTAEMTITVGSAPGTPTQATLSILPS